MDENETKSANPPAGAGESAPINNHGPVGMNSAAAVEQESTEKDHVPSRNIPRFGPKENVGKRYSFEPGDSDR